MVISEDTEIDIFVASRIGSFKHIKYYADPSKNSKKCIENIFDIKSLQKDEGITCLEWSGAEQNEILLSKKNKQIQIYDTTQGIKKFYTADFGTGDVVGLGRYKRKLLAAVANGTVKVWSKKSEVLIDTGGKLDRLRVCEDDRAIFGTGGEENDLKIWRIGEESPIFIAKNLPQDSLQLRRPVWVSDLTFLPGNGSAVVAVCSRHGYVRLYDIRAQRRPVSNVDFQMAATCITPSDDNQVIVGFGRGQIHQVDLRRSKPDKGYKGCAGAVTSLAVRGGVLVAGSLDRHLRVWDRASKQLLYKQYLTSKLSCVLVQSEGSTPLKHPTPPEEVKEEQIEDTDEMDDIFDKMEAVGEKMKKKIATSEEPQSKKVKPSVDGSTSVLEDSQIEEVVDDEDNAIAKLLRSTEKQKRRMEKKKRQKKAKSVFHNA